MINKKVSIENQLKPQLIKATIDDYPTIQNMARFNERYTEEYKEIYQNTHQPKRYVLSFKSQSIDNQKNLL